MNKKFIIALSFSALSYSVQSASLFDVPLGKKCYSIYQRLTLIEGLQTTSQCKDRLYTAKNNTEYAALKIANDESYAMYDLDSAIAALRHAQVYSCVNEEDIAKEEQNLLLIKEQYNHNSYFKIPNNI